MNILFLAPDVVLDGELKGDSIHTLEMTKSMLNSGANIKLVAHGEPDNWWGINKDIIVNLRNSDNHEKIITKELGDWRPDYIYERRYTPKLGLELSDQYDVPNYIEINGDVIIERRYEQGDVSRFREIASEWKLKQLYNKTTGIITVTDTLNRLVQKRYDLPEKKVHTIENGVNLSHFSPPEEYDSSSLPLKLVFVGNLVFWQGLEVLLLSLKNIENVHLSIIGSGRDYEKITLLINEYNLRDKVNMLGYIPYTDIPSTLRKHHVGVAPFPAERNASIGLSPLKIYEYMACGLPIITTNIDPLPNVIGDAGIIVEPNDEVSLTDAIKRIIDSDRKKMSSSAITTSSEHSWNTSARKIISLLGGNP